MVIISAINLTPETQKIKEEEFGGDKGNFSGWVQEKLLELKRQKLDPDYAAKKYGEWEAKRLEAETEASFWKKQIQNCKEVREAKIMLERLPQKKTKAEREKLIDIKRKQILLYYPISIDRSETIAEEYLNNLEQNPLLTIPEFMAQKGIAKKEKLG